MVIDTGSSHGRCAGVQYREPDRYLPGGCRRGSGASVDGTAWAGAGGTGFGCTAAPAALTEVVAKPVHRLRESMVEAGGVEPPSDKARNEENYVRIRLMIFDRHL